MKTDLFGNRLRGALPRWLGWGAACGAVSLGCAMVFGVNDAGALVAMILGIATWSVACALLTASGACARHLAAGAVWGRALVWGLWLRVGLSLLVLPDFWAGIRSMGLVDEGLRAMPGAWSISPPHCVWVYLTTLVQGIWVVGTLFGLTVLARLAMRRDEKAFASAGDGADAAGL